MRCLIVVGCCVMLSGCFITPAVVLTVLATGVSAYCVGVTDVGKQAIRDKTTGGTPVIACPEVADE